MRAEDILTEVQDKLRKISALRDQKVLDQAEKDQLIELEKQYQEGSERSGLIKVVNEGFWETFRREHQAALVLRQGEDTMPSTNQLLHLRDERGQRIGEWVGEKTVLGRDGRPLVKIGDFVLYEGVRMIGHPHFVVPEVEFPYLQGVKGIANVTSCSPSVPSDLLIRSWLDQHDEGLLTRIVGFDFDRDDLD